MKGAFALPFLGTIPSTKGSFTPLGTPTNPARIGCRHRLAAEPQSDDALPPPPETRGLYFELRLTYIVMSAIFIKEGQWPTVTVTEGGQIVLMKATHPGLVLKEELDGLGITPTELSRQIEVPPNRVSQIIAGKRSITGDTALRFGHWFGTDPQFWLNLQAQFDLAQADKEAGEFIRHLPTRASLSPQSEHPLGLG